MVVRVGVLADCDVGFWVQQDFVLARAADDELDVSPRCGFGGSMRAFLGLAPQATGWRCFAAWECGGLRVVGLF